MGQRERFREEGIVFLDIFTCVWIPSLSREAAFGDDLLQLCGMHAVSGRKESIT